MVTGLQLENRRLQQRLFSNQTLAELFEPLSEVVLTGRVNGPQVSHNSTTVPVFINMGQIREEHLMREMKGHHQVPPRKVTWQFLWVFPAGKAETVHSWRKELCGGHGEGPEHKIRKRLVSVDLSIEGHVPAH